MNKIAAGILCAGLLAMGTGKIASILVHPQPLKENAMKVDTSAIASGAPQAGAKAPEPVEPIVGLLAAADVAAGEKLHKACIACHTFEKGGANKVGPALFGIVGRQKGSHAGFAFSDGLKNPKGEAKWTYEELNHFLDRPREAVPGTKMTYAGMRKTADRAAMIAYLRSLADSPAPLPTADEIKAAEDAYKKAKGG